MTPTTRRLITKAVAVQEAIDRVKRNAFIIELLQPSVRDLEAAWLVFVNALDEREGEECKASNF